ncbi:MAG: hypothetical protein IPF47_07060 [Gemmatimonadetes bacterium]|nr:hypothetical protein [Gemmatimonadota bacterium]
MAGPSTRSRPASSSSWQAAGLGSSSSSRQSPRSTKRRSPSAPKPIRTTGPESSCARRRCPPPSTCSARFRHSRASSTSSPAYSAKHVGGERAYAVARRGEQPALVTSRVHVGEWNVLEQTPGSLRARITCGTGTYIRSLARDLGRATGSAAHLAALRRVQVGPFDVRDANGIEALRSGEITVRELHEALGDLPRQVLDDDAVRRVRQGLMIPASVAGARAALLDAHGDLVGVGARSGDSWHADVVLATT